MPAKAARALCGRSLERTRCGSPAPFFRPDEEAGGGGGRGGVERRAGRIWLGPRLEELRRRSAKSYWKTETSTLPGSELEQLRKRDTPHAAPVQVQVQVPRAGTERTRPLSALEGGAEAGKC